MYSHGILWSYLRGNAGRRCGTMDAAAVLLLWTCFFVQTINGFNVDTRAPLLFEGPVGSMFGFTVAQHRSGTTDWVLVGAPEASTNQPGVEKGGAVYRCPVAPLGNLGACEQILFDTTGDTPITMKSNQWFGATVESAGPDGDVVACAPRLLWFLDPDFLNKEREPTGTCFVSASDFTNIREYSPCQTNKTELFGFDDITHCQAGFSAGITPDSSSLVLGAPGSYYLQGQIYVQSLTSSQPAISTPEGKATFDNSYRGFSLALGDFNGDGVDDFVVGTPRGQSLLGLVSIFSPDLDSLRNITGTQLVSYFGNSVEAEDINNDGLDDLIVGAPMHTDKSSAIEKWEAGQVYVYRQKPDHTFEDAQLLTGSAIRARFGYSLSSLGDINQDDFNDIAIGAPFDGEDQTGLVYIYHGGGPEGLKTPAAQVLSPASFQLTNINTFGFSLQGGQDMDGNDYPDLLIGAENSDKALLVRARPVVTLHADLSLNPVWINLENKTYQLNDGTMVAGFLVTACFRYTGRYLPDNIAITYSLTLDSRIATNPRALFAEQNSNMLTSNRDLAVGSEFCSTHQAYIIKSIQDKYTALTVSLSYNLNQDESGLQSYDILPILDAGTLSSAMAQLNFQNNCNNSVCIPDLKVQAKLTKQQIVIGANEDVTLNVTITNKKADDAFQSSLTVKYPAGLQFVRLERTEQMDLSVTCSEDADNLLITCDTGNPFIGPELRFGLTLSTFQVGGDKESLIFQLNIQSENPDHPDTQADNALNVTIGVTVDVTPKLLSASEPEIVTYPIVKQGQVPPFPTKNASELDIGPSVMHLYEIRNAGSSTAGKIQINISWPLENANGDYLFYLLGLELAHNVTCVVTSGEINPLNVKLESGTAITYSALSRVPRQADAPQAIPQVDTIYCAGDSCVNLQCTVPELLPAESKVIKLIARLWTRTFAGSDGTELQSVASTASARVLEVPYNIPLPRPFEDSTKASTVVRAHQPQPKSQSIAWWIILLAVLGGIFLLLLIIVGLYKCGFFERKKPDKNEKGNEFPYEPVAQVEKDGPPTDGEPTAV